ncbi:universal stress protein [Halocalculus aciditolerans]|uniref:Universal stress protein n=1 Tax=Halocalculus aciditolerans TaxID=1383812 RepID=A0A830FF79_9EURY|nr:universal stress protein [Halocalculus aciditolerans]GGL47371.1 universal stress protein [Halocalculus aciditolerans]
MTKVLVPVKILEGESVTPGLFDLLSTVDVVVLGYYEVPDQTPAEQAKLQFEERAQAKLDELRRGFADAGGDAETRLAFTGEAEQTIARVTVEADCDAIVHPGVAHDADRLLVPFVGRADVGTVVDFVAALVGDRDITVSALGLDEAVSREEIRNALDAAGLDTADLTMQPESTGDAIAAIADLAVDYDLVVMGEPKPTLSEWVFGDLEDRVARESLGPVVVVRARD